MHFARNGLFVLAPVFAFAATLAVAAPASAQSAESFYTSHNKITLGSPSSAGGGYDTYVRLLGRHLPKHLPGTPTIVVQDVPAGGGMTLANMIYTTAAKDGTFLGLVRGPVLQEGILGNSAALFDGRRFAWIGNMDTDFDTCIVWTATGIQSIKDFYTREVIVGSSGAGANSSLFPAVYNDLLGTRLKIIAGYNGTPQRLLAMERGELHGACGISTSTIRSTLYEAYKSGKIKVIVQAGIGKDPEFQDVPNIIEEAKTPEVREALQFLLEGLELGRPLASAPETPADRVALLRRAFDETMKDADLVGEAKKLQLDIDVRDAAATKVAADRLYDTPKSAIERLQMALANAKK
jgi:tripartite-type tricarboxylate transporter receptor subunit TctC